MRWDMITRDIGAGIMVPKVPKKKYYTFGRSDLENRWGSNTLTLGSKPDDDKPKDSESKPDDDQSEVTIAWGRNTLTLGSNLCPVYS